MKNCNIGGQALIEGIFMRYEDDVAIAVRKSDNEIVIKKEEIKQSEFVKTLKKIPVVRGVISFIESLSIGYKALEYSAGFIEDDEQKKTDKKSKSSDKDGIFMAFTMLLSVILAVSLFIILPYVLAGVLKKLGADRIGIAIAEGVIRIFIFFAYMVLISLTKDIKRVFMYHGAEHKCINCIENELALNVDNVMKSSRFHKRCGTGFLFYIVIISVILFMFIKADTVLLRVAVRLLLVPLIAGLSYELLKLTGKADNAFIRVLTKPALFFQRFTTREPDSDMAEVAIAAIKALKIKEIS